MPFIDLGKRNKPTFWEYGSAFSFLNIKLPRTKYDIDLFLGVGRGDANSHCHHSDVIERNKKIMIEEFLVGNYDKVFFDLQIDLYQNKFEEISKIIKLDYVSDSNQVLAQKVYELTDCICTGHKPMLQALYTQYLADFFVSELKKVLTDEEIKNESKIQEYTSILLTTTKTSFAEQEDDLIQKVERVWFSRNYKADRALFSEFIKEEEVSSIFDVLVSDFSWFHMEYMREPFTRGEYVNYILERISKNNVSEEEDSKERRKKIIESQNKWFDDRKGNPNIEKFKKIVFGFQEFAYILDHSKVVTVHGIYISQPFFREVARRLGVDLQDMLFLSLLEVVDLLNDNKKADMDLINQRKKCRVVLLEKGTIKVYEGEKAEKIAKELLPENNTPTVKEIKGIIGYPGIVRGVVRVISSIKDKNKFKKGDILVTHDGTAELTIFLRDASAIVTDEGGMICHTTIVAREMKTPCVVGTRSATKIFKDGDIIEVDANNGVVKLVN